ncbi:MAG: Hpt domain-containing protein [Myxococcales bacterium]|nr:Hpt domain-containing protein [Myxococcales bacterium]
MFSQLRAALGGLRLPTTISPFEHAYLQRMNHKAVWFYLLHIPAFFLVAALNGTGMGLAVVLTTLVSLGPVMAARVLTNPRHVSLVHGVTAMMMGGLLVHFGQGPVQIEMHFYFFALLAMLAMFGNPAVILAAAATVALHHLVLWALLPKSVFNYDAPFWVVAVHAAFVVLESVGTCFIARTFFDNVIGLEKIVHQRTSDLDRRNQQMRAMFDAVDEGILTLDGQGRVAPEYARILESWFGQNLTGKTFADLLAASDPVAGTRFALGYEQLQEQWMPVEVALGQLPHETKHAGRLLQMRYLLLDDKASAQATPQEGGSPLEIMVMVSDVTAAREGERLAEAQRELTALVHLLVHDRTGLTEFLDEADALVKTIREGHASASSALMRALHTLKGNAGMYGLTKLSTLCHELETLLAEGAFDEVPAHRAALEEHWNRLRTSMAPLLGEGASLTVPVSKERFAELLEAVLDKQDHQLLAPMVAGLPAEPTATWLSRLAEQARRIAKRLGKGNVDVRVEDNGLRVDPSLWGGFWSSLIHVVRNAVDHGLPEADEQRARGHASEVLLRTVLEADTFVVEVADNGRGIDWAAIATRAKSLGLPAETDEQLHEAVFADGLSTARNVTEISGRGVGLGALRAVAVERGGTMELLPGLGGQGTCVRFTFPKHLMTLPPSRHVRQRAA